MEKIKVMLVDDQAILLDGLKAILETDSSIKVIQTAKNGKEAIVAIKEEQPDVVLMDIRMPDMDGVECAKLIKDNWQHISILMLTTFSDEAYILEALRCGACGYLLKDINGEKLIQAVKDAYKGDTILPASIAAQIASRITFQLPSKEEHLKNVLGLSEREAEVAVMISEGFNNKQIAAAIHISEGTVKNYTSSVYGKMQAEDRTAAAIQIRKILE